MSGTGRRDARNRGEGGPSAELVGVNRRRIGGEPRRRCDWAGESEIVAANLENLGGMVSPLREISVSGGRRSWPQGMWVATRCPDALVGPTYPAPAGPLLEPEGGGLGGGLMNASPRRGGGRAGLGGGPEAPRRAPAALADPGPSV